MAFFKFRFPGKGEAPEGRHRNGQNPKGLVRKTQVPPAESVESLRQRARHRVIGASVLVVLAVIGFPMLFDTEPRPVGNVPLAVPQRNEVSLAPGQIAPIVRVPHEESLQDNEEVVSSESSPVAEPVGAAAALAPARTETESAPVAQAVERDRAEERRQQREQADREQAAAREKAAREKADREKAAREKAAREKAVREKAERERLAKEKADRDKADRDKADREKRQQEARAERERQAKADREKADKDKASDSGRFVVQVGSFAEEDKAKAARTKLERAGITTYIQVIGSGEDKRTRVRIGPFGSRSEAEAAAKRVKALGLYAGIAEL